MPSPILKSFLISTISFSILVNLSLLKKLLSIFLTDDDNDGGCGDGDGGCGDSGCSDFFLLALGFLDTNVDTFPRLDFSEVSLLLSLLNNFRCIDLA